MSLGIIVAALALCALAVLITFALDSSRAHEQTAVAHSVPPPPNKSPAVRFQDIQHAGLIDPTELPIRTKIRGVSFNSQSTGERREFIIQTRCREGDALMLIREPNNVHDHNAIMVARMVLNEARGIAEVCDDLGHISRELAEELSVRIDGGEAFIAKISAITGDLEVDTDGDDGYNAGVNLRIYKLKDESALARTVLTARI